MKEEEFKKYVEKTDNNIKKILKDEELYFYQLLVNAFNQVCDERKNLEQALNENNKLKIQISARETLCEEYEQLINTILNFSFFKEECPLSFEFEVNSKEDKAQNIFYTDEYCENNCNDNYKDCWLKYFKELQKAKGDVKNENNVL